MNYVKLTKAQKERQREARNEFQIIIKRARAIGFNYLITRPPQTKVCFNSGVERKVLPEYDKIGEKLGPGYYELTYHRNQDHPVIRGKISKNGLGSMAFKSARFQKEPYDNGSFSYAPEPDTIKPHHQPFGINFKKVRDNHHKLTPGPGTYYSTFKRRLLFRHSFGGEARVAPAVRIICNPKNESKCVKCERQPEGDFYKNFTTESELCLVCMKREKLNAKRKAKSRLEECRRLDELESYTVRRLIL